MAGRTVMRMLIPGAWEAVAETSRWTEHRDRNAPRADPAAVEAIFGEAPDNSWRFYTFDEVVEMTADWHQEDDPTWFGQEPDAIEPKMSVLIGELGYDRPFALDYRASDPCVRFMRVDGRWPIVATTLRDLLDRLDPTTG